MVIVAKKVHPRALLLWVVLAAAVVGTAAAGTTLAGEARTVQAQAEGQVQGSGLRSNEDRVAYLAQWGWQTAEEPASVEDILLPEEFDPSYEDYLALQKSQGFDLASYGGKKVRRYTYAVTNYPGLSRDVWVSLLVYRRTAVGGEVFCSQGDGFLQGLAYPRGTEPTQEG